LGTESHYTIAHIILGTESHYTIAHRYGTGLGFTF